MLSMRPIVGAPGLASETWDTESFGYRAAGAALLSNLSIERCQVVNWNPDEMKLVWPLQKPWVPQVSLLRPGNLASGTVPRLPPYRLEATFVSGRFATLLAVRSPDIQ